MNGSLMAHTKKLEKIFTGHGYSDFKWIRPKDIVVSHWVRNKCRFGCPTYGKKGSCPPNNPPVSECREFFREYSTAAVFHFEKSFKDPLDRHTWTNKINLRLLKLEREVFLSGYYKAFLFFVDECSLCKKCPGTRVECINKESSRPCPESFGVDVFATVRSIGYPIEVLKDYKQKMNRYAFLMID